MSRSDRYLEAIRAFETWRLEQKAKPADLFSQPSRDSQGVRTPVGVVERWADEAMAAVEDAARQHRELTVADVDWSPTVDNRARGQVMQLAAKRGVLRRIGYVNGDRGRHGRPLVLWASRIYNREGEHE